MFKTTGFYARLIIPAFLALALVIAPSLTSANLQEQKKADAKKEGKAPDAKEAAKKDQKAGEPKVEYTQAEIIAEYAIIAYGTREQLQKARASIREEGNIRLASDQGDITGTHLLRSMRRDKSWQDLLRVDLELNPPEAAQRQGAPSSIKYVAAFNGASMWSAQNGQYVTPRPEVQAAFLAQLTHDYTTLLRYKEDGSKLEYKGQETVVGLPAHVIELTTPNGEKTKYYISTKSYRILHLDYELKLSDDQPPTKYRISYYYTPLKVVQNTLVPTRRVITQDGKFVQEITFVSADYSAKLDPEIFQHLQE
ncbi:MAG TPA: hypothetical protein VNO70_20835 [Blastocatellia bacterium]|nr:hypothetical protein [Blastocatellia bacterium]